MSDSIISVQGLSKRYMLGRNQVQRERYVALRDVIMREARTAARRGRNFLKGAAAIKAPSTEEFWALRDVSFEVKRGDVLGIIGRNGAGKSTLLKILSRITEPTEGRVELRGRVASLLEVGTGFHPELTGRENIFLNGAILGMAQREVSRKLDEIVAFAEIAQFLDTPVKRYSSGMYVRLAFAVAAHLDPEILIVDEVLAVGDAEFQKKCLGKMGQVSRGEGRTVLFVSHNTLAVQKLCTKGLLIEGGRSKVFGNLDAVLTEYLTADAGASYVNDVDAGQPRVVAVTVLTPRPRTNMPLDLMIEWYLPESLQNIKIGVGFNTIEGQRIFDSAPEDLGLRSPNTRGKHNATIRVPPNTLMAKDYGVSVGLWYNSTVYDHANPAVILSVEASPSGPYSHEQEREGLANVIFEWNMLPERDSASERQLRRAGS
ncbi:MAG: ATP-binding cassette domain-containing protein [Alphaproteobacteria bacterium]|nr:ATP-binding cassette domain-containing protein [Alphaproteobacteria bacterium]